MTVSCKFSFMQSSLHNRLLIETTLQDFDKKQLSTKVNKKVDSTVLGGSPRFFMGGGARY